MQRTFFNLTALFLSVLLLSSASAQSLADLLPAETFLAFGTRDLAQHEAKLEPFIAEFERLELGAALAKLVPSEAVEGELEQDDAVGDVMTQFEGLEVLDFLGQEAWLALSASSFNPLPALTLLTELSPEAAQQISSTLSEATAKDSVETLTEGNYTFYQEALEDADEFIQVLAYAQVDNTLMLSTNPNTLRAALRQLGGSSDPSFANSVGYANTLGQVGEGNFYGYLDFAQVASVIAPFAQGFGFDQLVERLIDAFATAGVSAGTLRVTEDGFEREGLQAANADGGDASLYALLTSPAQANASTITLAPESALSWSSSVTDLTGWWDYLNEIMESSPELGGNLDFLLASFLGVDLRETFFNWVGNELTTVTTGVGEIVEPGMPSSNLLGDSVYILEASDEAAAQAGLSNLLQTVSTLVASFADPSGGAGSASSETLDIAGVEATTFTITEGISLSYAVADGHAFIGTSSDALTAVLEARGGDSSLRNAAVFGSLQTTAPDTASSLSLSNNQATLANTAQQITSQLQLTAGLGGAANLDFDAVEEASEKLEQFLAFVAERLGFSTSYSERRGDGVYTFGQSDVSW